MTEFGDCGESYLALIGDVEGSRDHPDRQELRARLTAGLEGASADLALGVPLRITAGDEFQGLLDASRAFDAVAIMVRVTETLFPVRLAWGLGWGPLSTAGPRAEDHVAELDGPCFHRAREALGSVKKEGGWARIQGLREDLDAVLNGTFGLMAAIREGWTEKQATYVRDARTAARFKDVAERHEVFPSTVTESLQAAHYRALTRAEGGIELLLEVFGRTTESRTTSAE